MTLTIGVAGGLDLPTTADPVSSSGFGGGSSDRGNGTVPSATINVTPPSLPLVLEEAGHLHGKCNCQPAPHPYTFSPKTCLELLKRDCLTTDQLDFERNYLKSLGHDIDTRARVTTSKPVILKALEGELILHTLYTYENDIRRFTNVMSHFSYLTEHAEAKLEKMRSMHATISSTPVPPVTPPSDLDDDLLRKTDQTLADCSIEEVKVDDSVCRVFDFDLADFSDLTVADVLDQLTVDNPVPGGNTNRSTAYYGNIPYSYGHVRHDACPYPTCDVFTKIFSRMESIDQDFTRDNYTCLVTHYPNGKSYIPQHSDNEAQIIAGSRIYTISLGATRSLTLQNQDGAINEVDFDLAHGSLYSMTQESQASWKHGIKVDGNVSSPRISFTFRHLIPEGQLPKRPRAPPIQHPDRFRGPNSTPQGTHKRILLLTDSVIGGTPPHIFNSIGKYRCIKKINKRLVDAFNFEPEFRCTDTVIISCGVNDLSCYGLRAHVLADMVVRRLADTCRKHRSTTFVFNSLLHTRIQWLNEEIDAFNKVMFELSFQVPNLKFFDSHAVLFSDKISRRVANVILAADPRGIHITNAARHLITEHLVNCIEDIACARSGRAVSPRLWNWSWPIRQEFVECIPDIRARRAVAQPFVAFSGDVR